MGIEEEVKDKVSANRGEKPEQEYYHSNTRQSNMCAVRLLLGFSSSSSYGYAFLCIWKLGPKGTRSWSCRVHWYLRGANLWWKCKIRAHCCQQQIWWRSTAKKTSDGVSRFLICIQGTQTGYLNFNFLYELTENFLKTCMCTEMIFWQMKWVASMHWPWKHGHRLSMTARSDRINIQSTYEFHPFSILEWVVLELEYIISLEMHRIVGNELWTYPPNLY